MFTDLFYSRIFNIPKNSVIIVYQGGFGNQLFQYFLGKELEEIYKKKIYFYDIRNDFKTRHNSDIQNLFELNIERYNGYELNLIFRFFFLSPIFLKFYKFIFLKFNIKIIPNYFFDRIEKPLDLNKVFKKENPIILFGTWQNLINQYKYSTDAIQLKLKKNIQLPKGFNFKKKFISLHVRRGDYCNYKEARFHGNLKINYYLEGVNFLRDKFGDIPVFLFSDDKEWLRNNLSNLIPNSFVISSAKSSPEIDFYIMTRAHYFILSNSTFSWLAAFLSKYEKKFIVLPSFWFKDQKISSFYIYKDWQYKVI